MNRNLNESQVQGANNAQTHYRPAALDNLLVGDAPSEIPHQMANSVQSVEGEGKRYGRLQKDLGDERESSKCSGQRGRLEMPAQSGSSEVGNREEIQRTRQDETGVTVQSTENPGDLRTVDGEVRRNGAVKTLLGEKLGWIRGLRSNLPSTKLSYQPDCRDTSEHLDESRMT